MKTFKKIMTGIMITAFVISFPIIGVPIVIYISYLKITGKGKK